MPHDKDVGGVGNQLAQRAGHDPAFDLGAPLQLLGMAAEKFKVELVLDDHLVAAPGQGHFHREGGVLKELLEGIGVPADADGEGGRHALGVEHATHRLQHREFPLPQGGEEPLLKEEEIPVPVILAQQAAGRLAPGADVLVDGVDHRGLLVVADALHQLLIVVHREDGAHRAGAVKFLPHGGVVAHVHPVGGGQKAVGPLFIGADQMAEHQEAAAGELHLHGALRLSLHQPAGGKTGHHRGEPGVKEVLPLPGELKKAVVGPDDLVALRTENDHGEGRIDHGVLGGHVNIAGDVVDILEDLLLPLGIAPAEIGIEQEDHNALRAAQPGAEKGGGDGKEHQTDKIELKTGLQ